MKLYGGEGKKQLSEIEVRKKNFDNHMHMLNIYSLIIFCSWAET